MFDSLTPAQLVETLARLLREAARWERPLDEFQTSQLLSASSLARHLAAELSGAGAELARFAERAAAEMDAAAAEATDPQWCETLRRARSAITDGRAVMDPAQVAADLGGVLVDVLRAARRSSDPSAIRYQASLRAVLADLVHRHVALLGGSIHEEVDR